MIDFHSHILPGMDFDGTDDIGESVAICETLKKQGVATVCATPHFYPWNDDVDAFLRRRELTYLSLERAGCPIEVVCGAEVQIFRDLPESRMDKMCMGASNVILFEMPTAMFQKWMITAIENTVYKYSLVPMIAHIERYAYPIEVLQRLARIPNVIFQVSVSELQYRDSVKLLDALSSCGVPVVFGSDAHNMTTRSPQFDIVGAKMAEKPSIFNRNLKTTQAVIENALQGQQYVESLLSSYKAEKVK